MRYGHGGRCCDRGKMILYSGSTRLRDMNGFGSFYAAQVVAEMKYVAPLRSARDWWTFAAPGPGSKRGLNRVLGRPKDAPWRDDDVWRAAFARLHEAIAPELERIGIGRLCGQDLQNCLCEFDKMERARLGEGKPKRRFVPHRTILPPPQWPNVALTPGTKARHTGTDCVALMACGQVPIVRGS